MALSIRLHNQNDDEMIYAVVRMDGATHALLKKFMHCTDQIAIRFPHGVKLCSRGRGWYRLDASNAVRGVEKLQFAVKLIRRFLKEEEHKTEEEIKRLAPLLRNPDLKIVSFSNAHSPGEYGYIDTAPDRPALPVSTSKLNALAAKFQRSTQSSRVKVQ